MTNWTPIQPKQFSAAIYKMSGISRSTVENHIKLYEGYVKKTNEIMEKLVGVDVTLANQVYSEIRELKVELSFAIGGVKNHELYFSHLGGQGGEPQGQLKQILEENWGSFENWKNDLKATAMAARGWAWLGYDRDLNHWHNYLGDSQNSYPIWDASVVLALDTYEHAYWADYGTNRAEYLEAFFRNIDWGVVEKKVENGRVK